jgi:hypothetical protein
MVLTLGPLRVLLAEDRKRESREPRAPVVPAVQA